MPEVTWDDVGGLEEAKRANPAQKWIVADPRRTETAALATLSALQLLWGDF